MSTVAVDFDGVIHDPEGFQVLCWNCNLGKYYNGGVCPHRGAVDTTATRRVGYQDRARGGR